MNTSPKEKTKIGVKTLLPDVPDEQDECVNRLIHSLQDQEGIEKVHMIPEKEGQPSHLCFHYDSSLISSEELSQKAEREGRIISSKIGHLLLDVEGIKYPRRAAIIESSIKKITGVMEAAVAATGYVQIEYDKHLTDAQALKSEINKLGLTIKNDNARLSISVSKCSDDEPAGCCGGHSHDENHKSQQIFGERTELIFSLICGSFLALGFAMSFLSAVPAWLVLGFYLVSYLFGGWYTAQEAYQGISKGKFDIDFLMLVAAIGAAILGYWLEGALLLFLFSLSHSLEHYAMEKAKKSITALAQLTPKVATIIVNGKYQEVKIEQLKIGDIVSVKPNSTIAADGIVIAGSSSVNQAPITGESIPVDKFPIANHKDSFNSAEKIRSENKVFAGTINGSQALEIKVIKIAADSTIARLVEMVKEAQTQKSKTQIFTNKIEKIYVPGVLIVITLLLFAFLVVDETFSQSLYRAMAVLVGASPCALAIATPSVVLSGVARAARGGVLIKGGRPLEELGMVTAIAFDKTGTLTEGNPKLTGVYPLGNVSEDHLLEVVVAVEKLSDHTLAAAIVKDGLARLKRDVAPAQNVVTIVGHGVEANFRDASIKIGNKKLFKDCNNLSDEILSKVDRLEKEGQTVMLVREDERFIGVITLMDTLRSDAKETVQQLKKLGLKEIVMLTGDNKNVAASIADELGITNAQGNLLPEGKVKAIEELNRQSHIVAMLGDGVNDAPAMAKSTIGIAMGGAGSDVALETADVALMADKLSGLPFAIALGKKAKQIIKQNLVISLGMVALLVPLTLMGYATIGPAVVGHEGSTLIVVFNSLRLLGFSGKK